jgi:transposase
VTDVAFGGFLALRDQGETVAGIAKRYGVSRATVTRWLARSSPPSQQPKRQQSAGKRAQVNRRRKLAVKLVLMEKAEVRKRVTPKRKLVRQRTVTIRQFPSPRAVAREMTRLGVSVSPRTVRRDLRAEGLKPYSQPKGPHLTDALRKYRVEFAKRMLRQPKEERMKILFSDEKYFDTRTQRFMSYWDTCAQDLPSGGYVQGGPKVMVLGFISRTDKHLVVFDEKKTTMNKELYTATLEGVLPLLKRHWFQQDNASPHAAAVRDGWFTTKKVKTMQWPAFSPDLNVIENAWAMLAAEVARCGPTAVDEIAEFVRAAWAGLTQKTIVKLCDGFEDRLRVCIEGDGRIVTRTKVREFRRRQKAAKSKRNLKK